MNAFFQRFEHILPVGAMVLATCFWGSTFLTVSHTLSVTNPITLTFSRFLCGSLLLLPFVWKSLPHIPRYTWRAGIICGFLIALSYTSNAVGLMWLESSTSGFITALYVPFTPFLMWFIYGRRPEAASFFGVAVALGGLFLLAHPTELTFSNSPGELFTLLCAFASALEIVIVGKYAPHCKARELAFTQLVSVAFFVGMTLLVLMLCGVPLKDTTLGSTFWSGVLWLAFIVACVQILLSWAQKSVPPSRAAVIFALESVFAGILGYIAGERLGIGGITGGCLIVLAVFISEAAFLRDPINRLFAKPRPTILTPPENAKEKP